MTPERINELREYFEYEHPVNECIDEIERLRKTLRESADAIEEYCSNCDRDHIESCQFCREQPDGSGCTNEPRDDFIGMRRAHDRARAALEGK